jgi:hypothetical protein
MLRTVGIGAVLIRHMLYKCSFVIRRLAYVILLLLHEVVPIFFKISVSTERYVSYNLRPFLEQAKVY